MQRTISKFLIIGLCPAWPFIGCKNDDGDVNSGIAPTDWNEALDSLEAGSIFYSPQYFGPGDEDFSLALAVVAESDGCEIFSLPRSELRTRGDFWYLKASFPSAKIGTQEVSLSAKDSGKADVILVSKGKRIRTIPALAGEFRLSADVSGDQPASRAEIELQLDFSAEPVRATRCGEAEDVDAIEIDCECVKADGEVFTCTDRIANDEADERPHNCCIDESSATRSIRLRSKSAEFCPAMCSWATNYPQGEDRCKSVSAPF